MEMINIVRICFSISFYLLVIWLLVLFGSTVAECIIIFLLTEIYKIISKTTIEGRRGQNEND